MLISIHVDKKHHISKVEYSEQPSGSIQVHVGNLIKEIDPDCISTFIYVEGPTAEIESNAKAVDFAVRANASS
jgi:hypothetical protein